MEIQRDSEQTKMCSLNSGMCNRTVTLHYKKTTESRDLVITTSPAVSFLLSFKNRD